MQIFLKIILFSLHYYWDRINGIFWYIDIGTTIGKFKYRRHTFFRYLFMKAVFDYVFGQNFEQKIWLCWCFWTKFWQIKLKIFRYLQVKVNFNILCTFYYKFVLDWVLVCRHFFGRSKLKKFLMRKITLGVFEVADHGSTELQKQFGQDISFLIWCIFTKIYQEK